MWAINRAGGKTLIQNPADAGFPENAANRRWSRTTWSKALFASAALYFIGH
jgi:hypothetical protein